MIRNLIIVCLSVILSCSVLWAAKADLPVDGKGVKIQSCAPTLINDVALTGNSQNKNVTNSTCWKAYVVADGKFRLMSTQTKVGIQHTLKSGAWHTETVSDYKFVNFSTTAATGTFRSDEP